MFKVLLSREAQRFYDRCDQPASRKLARCFASLENNPKSGNNVKALKGKLSGFYRYRTGNLRVVYQIEPGALTVNVITIANRADVYG